jgi:hypothetical protein
MKKLFLDDFRNPKDAFTLVIPHLKIFWEDGWDIVRSYDEFVSWIEANGLPDFISFDHDLADEHYEDVMNNPKLDYSQYREKTGLDCAKWLVDWCVDNKLSLPDYAVHSANPPGRRNIEQYLVSASKHLFSDDN